MESGQRLRDLRQRHRMTQSQLAKRLGITEFTVCRYENGQIAMTVETIKRAAAVFDVCPSYFLDDKRYERGQDPELADLFRRADRLGESQRGVIKHTLRALLDSLAEPGGPPADTPETEGPRE